MQRRLTGEQAQEAFGAAIGNALPADRNNGLVIFLQGELGAGKTTLVRGLLRALGWTGPVKSPTYTLLESYELAQRRLYHLDLYRLADPEELEYLGLRDLEANALLLIEWPEAFRKALPPADLVIAIRYADAARELNLSACSPAGEALLDSLADAKT